MTLKQPWSGCFFLGRKPSDVGDPKEMKAAGFVALFVNVRDYKPNEWTQVRLDCEKAGIICGPWARTAKGDNDLTWAPEVLEMLINTAHQWETPYIPNCEKEIDFSGKDITSFIADAVGDDNAAISTLARPMQAVDWRPIAHLPILAQLFVESGQTDPENVKQEWFNFGINCLLGTLGAYGGRTHNDYPLNGPYSVYTSDDAGHGRLSNWSPIRMDYKPCKEEPVPPTPEKPQYPWKKSYPRADNAPAGPAELIRPLYPPDAAAKGKTPSPPGPDIEAYKRAMKRGQQGAAKQSFSQLDDAYGNVFAHGGKEPWPGGIAGFQRCQSIDDTGWVGDKTYQAMRYAAVPAGPNKGEPLFDEKCLELLRQAQKMFRPQDDVTRVRSFIAEFCKIAESNEAAWHYSQARPVKVLVNPDATSVTSDCSGYVIQAYAYARAETELPVKDPAKQNWSGFGNTGEFEDDWPRVTSGQYEIGDLAHYNGHVTICRAAGSPDTAWFSSHGQEAGPEAVRLHYRTDLRFVVRPVMFD